MPGHWAGHSSLDLFKSARFLSLDGFVFQRFPKNTNYERDFRPVLNREVTCYRFSSYLDQHSCAFQVGGGGLLFIGYLRLKAVFFDRHKITSYLYERRRKRGRHVSAMWQELISAPSQGWACQQVGTVGSFSSLPFSLYQQFSKKESSFQGHISPPQPLVSPPHPKDCSETNC